MPEFKTKVEERQAFDAQGFLDSARVAKKVVRYGGKEIVFSQGDPATRVLYIQNGALSSPLSMRPVERQWWRC